MAENHQKYLTAEQIAQLLLNKTHYIRLARDFGFILPEKNQSIVTV